MVSISVRPKRSARHIDDGDIVLPNGRVTLLDDISGNTWTRSRLRRLAAAVQGRMDHRRLIADLRDIDPDKTHALYLTQRRPQFLEQRREVDDCRVGIFLVGDHEDGEVASLFDCAVEFGERRALGPAEEHRLAFSRNEHRTGLKLRAPARQVPPVAYVELVVIDKGHVEVFFLKQRPHLREPLFTFFFPEIAHRRPLLFLKAKSTFPREWQSVTHRRVLFNNNHRRDEVHFIPHVR